MFGRNRFAPSSPSGNPLEGRDQPQSSKEAQAQAFSQKLVSEIRQVFERVEESTQREYNLKPYRSRLDSPLKRLSDWRQQALPLADLNVNASRSSKTDPITFSIPSSDSQALLSDAEPVIQRYEAVTAALSLLSQLQDRIQKAEAAIDKQKSRNASILSQIEALKANKPLDPSSKGWVDPSLAENDRNLETKLVRELGSNRSRLSQKESTLAQWKAFSENVLVHIESLCVDPFGKIPDPSSLPWSRELQKRQIEPQSPAMANSIRSILAQSKAYKPEQGDVTEKSRAQRILINIARGLVPNRRELILYALVFAGTIVYHHRLGRFSSESHTDVPAQTTTPPEPLTCQIGDSNAEVLKVLADHPEFFYKIDYPKAKARILYDLQQLGLENQSTISDLESCNSERCLFTTVLAHFKEFYYPIVNQDTGQTEYQFNPKINKILSAIFDEPSEFDIEFGDGSKRYTFGQVVSDPDSHPAEFSKVSLVRRVTKNNQHATFVFNIPITSKSLLTLWFVQMLKASPEGLKCPY